MRDEDNDQISVCAYITFHLVRLFARRVISTLNGWGNGVVTPAVLWIIRHHGVNTLHADQRTSTSRTYVFSLRGPTE